ncbi:MAG TPA: hypothetical protein VNZ55_14310 [Thermomicrobiales bacterium]|nr:hypothetical protein [Thermomicrobiales bacterium]
MPDYGRPFFLTGHFGRPLSGITLPDLCAEWRVPETVLATLRDVGGSRSSVAICSERSGAGKTLLLEALLASLPRRVTPIYLRGGFERFAFLADPAVERPRSVLVANEISPFEDVYLWGEQARRTLTLACNGWTLWCTAHAASASDLIGQWVAAGLVMTVADLPERLVVISLAEGDTGGRRTLTFETIERGVFVDSSRW